MQFANFLKKGDAISLVAPSYGSPNDPYKIRLLQAIVNFESLGYTFNKGNNIFLLAHEESNTPILRAKEWMEAYLSNSSFVWSIAGGELMALILPFIDFEAIKSHSLKWFMGYSDNTVLTYTLTTCCDIATIYSYHPHFFCVTPFSSHLQDVYELMIGKKLKFKSHKKYEVESLKNEFYFNDLNFEKKVEWKNLSGNACEKFKGRCIGGCLDVLSIIAGTKYDKTIDFIKRYHEDGFIWYFDIYGLSPTNLSLTLFKLKELGWFNHINGILISRIPNNIMITSYQGDLSYKMVFHQYFDEYHVPVIYDCDIGHVSPAIPIINGAIMEVNYKKGKAEVEFFLK